MKIQKEMWLVVTVVAFLLAYVIDILAGPVKITVGNPVAFLTSPVLLNLYPFTAAAIVIRSIALFISVMIIISFIERQYFAKIAILVFVGILAEFYSIQQLANGFKMTTIQWTLSIAYGSVLLVLGIIGLTLKGIWSMFNKEETASAEGYGESKEQSVLNPPTNN